MTSILSKTETRARTPASRRSVPLTLAPLEAIAVRSESLISRHVLLHDESGKAFWLPRYLFIGPKGGDNPLRVGLFAGIHGDEPEGVHALVKFVTLLDQQPELARGYCLFIYPICNPSGFEDNTRNSRKGHDLNREFWKGSRQPEVIALQSELVLHALHGVVALHADNTSEGVYGYVRGSTLTRHLLKPALRAAEEFLPLDRRTQIDGFGALDGIVTECFPGVLGPPPEVHPRPFEIIFETPQHAMPPLQHGAMSAVLQSILEEYRKFIAYMRNL